MKFLVIVGALLSATLIQGELDSSLSFPEDATLGGRVIQGSPAAANQFPFMVRLHMAVSGGTRLCGGSLISTRYVLTAAHCLISSSSVQVRMGSIDSDNPSRTVNTPRYIVHPQYNANTLNNDIALADMQTDVPVAANIRPILLPRASQTSTTFADQVATVAGWGRTTDNGGQSRYLNYVNLRVVTNARCQQDYGSIIIASTICAVGIQSPAQSSCQGDSGGALFLADTDGQMMQVGVVSFVSSLGCSADRASGYVRPHHYWAWINSWTGIPIRN